MFTLMFYHNQDGEKELIVGIDFEKMNTPLYRQLHPSLLKVMVCLIGHMNVNSYSCYPNISTISKETGLAVNTVRTALRQLHSLGLISITQGVSPVNPQLTKNIYDISKEHIRWLNVMDTTMNHVEPELEDIDIGFDLIDEAEEVPDYDSINMYKERLSKDKIEDLKQEVIFEMNINSIDKETAIENLNNKNNTQIYNIFLKDVG